MTDWVFVNGSRIERSFLRENVAEARTYAWEKSRWAKPDDHAHCMVCAIALSEGEVCYRSAGGWLCPYCHETFVIRDVP